MSDTQKPVFDAFIFDLDGLLVDSETVWHIAERELVESRGHEYPPEVRAQIIGLRMDEFLEVLHRIYHFTESIPALYDELTNRMLELIPLHVKPQPGADELVRYVAQMGYTRAIASSSPMSIIDMTVESQGWGEIFAVRCSADDDPHGKPAPDVYLRTARVLGADPARCLALEDSPNGSRAAVAAGMTCYAVPDPTHSLPTAFAGVTPHVFGSLVEVLEKLKVSSF